MGAPRGVATDLHDEPDDSNAGDVLQELGGYGLASGCRVRRVDQWFLVGIAQ
jgi:hypothetical protein